MSFLKLENITMTYDKKNKILDGFNLEIKEGELLGLLGPSGSGKSTTLSLIAGFNKQTNGQILVAGKDISNKKIEDRNLGVVFQSYALFPHLTVFDNVAFGLKRRKNKKKIDKQKVIELIDKVGLSEHKDKYPSELSGGQQQRVALARAIVIEPQILLLDEPLSNLDAKLRLEMRELIRNIQQQYKITTLFVTHDQEECFAISDQVAVMNKGIIEQQGTPEYLFDNPKTKFVADFIGIDNIFESSEINKIFDINKDLKYTAFRAKDVSLTTQVATLNNCEVLTKTYVAGRYKYSIQTEVGIIKALTYTDININSFINLNVKKENLILIEE